MALQFGEAEFAFLENQKETQDFFESSIDVIEIARLITINFMKEGDT